MPSAFSLKLISKRSPKRRSEARPQSEGVSAAFLHFGAWFALPAPTGKVDEIDTNAGISANASLRRDRAGFASGSRHRRDTRSTLTRQARGARAGRASGSRRARDNVWESDDSAGPSTRIDQMKSNIGRGAAWKRWRARVRPSCGRQPNVTMHPSAKTTPSRSSQIAPSIP